VKLSRVEAIDVHKPATGKAAAASVAVGSVLKLARRRQRLKNIRIFSYAVSRIRLERVIEKLRATAVIVSDIDRADLILILKSQEKRQPGSIREAEARGTPRYVLKSNTTTQMENFLRSIFPSLPEDVMNEDEAAGVSEARAAVEAIRVHGRPVELSPQNSRVRRLQHLLAEQSGVRSQSIGMEPNRRVIIHPEQSYFRSM
jgi:hypothetical protein